MNDNYSVFQMANLLSHTVSSDIDKSTIVSNNLRFLQSEIDTGVDRSRSAIGYSVQLNWLEQISDASSSAMDIEILSRSIVEMAIRMKNPNKMLFCGMNYILASTLQNIVETIHYVNTTSIDYMEKYSGTTVPDGDIVLMQDFSSGNIANDYDLVLIDVEIVSHDFSIIDNVWSALQSNSILILNIVNDFGSLYSLKNKHPYFQYLSLLTEDDDKYLFHIPLATGFTFVVKK